MSRRRKAHSSKQSRHDRLRTIVPPTKSASSNHQNPGCYARVLGGCSETLSDEHFVSFSLLMRLCRDQRGIFVRGLGRNSGGKWIQPERVVGRVLCTTHNHALSPFDDFIGNFGDELTRSMTAATEGRLVSTVVGFSGCNLERWMLKALCGLVASDQAARSGGEGLSNSVPEIWVRWLFAQADFLPPLGLYVNGEIGHQVAIDPSVRVGPLTTGRHEVVGLEFSFQWFNAVLILVDWQGTPTGAIDSASIRRPRNLVLTNRSAEHRIELGWVDAGPGVEIEYRTTPG
jgi:hypothetical protein